VQSSLQHKPASSPSASRSNPSRTHSASASIDRPSRLAIEIGGFTFGMCCQPNMSVRLDDEHQRFVLPNTPQAGCHFELDIAWADSLNLPARKPSFVSGGLWSAFRVPTGTEFYFNSPALGPAPYKAAWLDDSFSRGHVLFNRSLFQTVNHVFPLEYPIDELITMHRLSLGEGVEVHALGLADEDGQGYLFLGHSGAGKSTSARLWMSMPGVKLLSDDRIIIRKQDGQFWMYGTPWHGDAGVSSPGRAPLSAIFFLEQAPANELLPIARTTAAAELFARAFVPHYLEAAIRFTLGFLDDLTHAIPCSSFRFTPTKSAVEAIRHARA
jgi:hypothetical protein